MTELSFAKSFLTTLSSQSTKVSPDHVEDPKKYPSRPTFNLPKHTKPFLKRRRLNLESSSTVTVQIKSQRNPSLDHTLHSQTLSTSILDIKNVFSTKVQVPLEKIKLLHNKKPVVDSKVLKDLIVNNKTENTSVDPETTVELSVMVLGGPTSTKGDIPEATNEASKAESKESGRVLLTSNDESDVLKSEGFWLDFKKFLDDRLDDTVKKQRITDLLREIVMRKES